MSHSTTKPQPGGTSPEHAQGALLSDIYGRLVPIHASLDEGNLLDTASLSDIARDLMGILRLIEANDDFQAARAAVRAQRKVSRSPHALAAEERVRRGREARREAASRS